MEGGNLFLSRRAFVSVGNVPNAYGIASQPHQGLGFLGVLDTFVGVRTFLAGALCLRCIRQQVGRSVSMLGGSGYAFARHFYEAHGDKLSDRSRNLIGSD